MLYKDKTFSKTISVIIELVIIIIFFLIFLFKLNNVNVPERCYKKKTITLCTVQGDRASIISAVIYIITMNN